MKCERMPTHNYDCPDTVTVWIGPHYYDHCDEGGLKVDPHRGDNDIPEGEYAFIANGIYTPWYKPEERCTYRYDRGGLCADEAYPTGCAYAPMQCYDFAPTVSVNATFTGWRGRRP